MSEFFTVWKERFRSLRELDYRGWIKVIFLIVSMILAFSAIASRSLRWYSSLPPARDKWPLPSRFVRSAMPPKVIVQKFVIPQSRTFP